MYQYKFIYIAPLLLSTPIIITSCSLPQSQNQNIIDNTDSKDFNIDNADQMFPKMEIKDYYKYVKFNNHQPVITDELIVQFIKDVMKKVATSKGKISFNVDKKSPSNVEINFKWEYNDKALYKKYILKLK